MSASNVDELQKRWQTPSLASGLLGDAAGSNALFSKGTSSNAIWSRAETFLLSMAVGDFPKMITQWGLSWDII